MDDVEYREIVSMRIKNMKYQIYLMEKYFPWTCGPYEDEELQEGKEGKYHENCSVEVLID